MNKTQKANDAETELAPKHKLKKNSQKLIIYIVGVIYLVVFTWFIVKSNQKTIYINNVKFHVRIANTPAERTQGLSGTSKLGSNEGMLFIFQYPGEYGFWMKDMNYSLDIIWISADKKVVSDSENLAPSTYPEAYYPNTPAKYVLEVDAGTSKRLNIHDGTTVKF